MTVADPAPRLAGDADLLPRGPRAGVLCKMKDAFRHLSVLADTDNPLEVIFENFDLAIGQTDRSIFFKT
ncbi:hypothetical protein [Neorhizobium sp. NCHU2750]|uniref:hypothetical protein n=1 Tax=Neorhizobium sp. NCHU2750 TaxID=1825976 RepID=UPI0013C431CA